MNHKSRPKAKAVPCSYCQKTFATVDAVLKHERAIHAKLIARSLQAAAEANPSPSRGTRRGVAS